MNENNPSINLFEMIESGAATSPGEVQATRAALPDFRTSVAVRIAAVPVVSESEKTADDQNYWRLVFVVKTNEIKGLPSVGSRVFSVPQRDLPAPDTVKVPDNMTRFLNCDENAKKAKLFGRDRAIQALAAASGYAGPAEGIVMFDLMRHLAAKGYVVGANEVDPFGEKTPFLRGFWMPAGGDHPYGDIVLMSEAAHQQACAAAVAAGSIPELRAQKKAGKAKGGAAKAGGPDAKEADV